MQLTRRQLKTLRLYKSVNENQFAWGAMLANFGLVWGRIAAVVACGIWAIKAGDSEDVWATSGLIGFFVGFLLRDTAQLRISKHIWPVTRQILDWKKIDELLARAPKL